MPLTTGKTTGKSAYGPSGGNAVGMGAPGFGSPAETARTLAARAPRVPPMGTAFSQRGVPQVQPPSIAPSSYPVPGQVTDYFSQATRMDPGIIAKMLGQQGQIQPAGINYGRPSAFPARPGATTRVGQPRDMNGNDQFGHSFGNAFGSRTTRGNTGGGFGGGGGGGF